MYGDIADQINMPPSLLSRFDLIFIMTDQPEQKKDLAIAEHILKAHSTGELIAQHKRTPIPGVTDEYIAQQLKPVMPDIDPVLFRKYVAYSKRSCFPILSPEAKEVLVAYYLKLRGLAEPNKAVPVTARQLEALVRLGEASARIRLSDAIERTDAERVIRIVDACLRQVAYDAKTGTFDIDKVATGISKEKRDIVRVIKDAIRDIGGDAGRAPKDQVIEAVVSKGFSKDKVESGIDMLNQAGELMEPKHGIIQLIR
jgi:replicative DNA helicase Mcm